MSISIVLQTPRRTAADRAWGEPGLRDAAAAHATTTLLPGAAVLPLTTFLDANVYPVVVWDRRALSLRLTRMDGPAVSTDAVRDLLDAGCPTVLRVAANLLSGTREENLKSFREKAMNAQTLHSEIQVEMEDVRWAPARSLDSWVKALDGR